MTSSVELVTPGQGRGLLDVVRWRYLLKLIVRKEIRVRYRGSALGMLWSYVKPAIQFGVYYVALGIFLNQRSGVEYYPVFLFSGIIVMNFFSEGFSNATRSLIWNAPLINKIYLPRELFPVASLYVSAVHFLPQLIVLISASLFVGWRPSFLELLAGAIGFAIIALMALGLGLIFGSINVFFRDAENFVDLILMMATWGSPVIYTLGQVRDVLNNVGTWAFFAYIANPLTIAVELFHYAFWPGGTDSTGSQSYQAFTEIEIFTLGGLGLLITLFIAVLGQFVFRRLEGRFAQEL